MLAMPYMLRHERRLLRLRRRHYSYVDKALLRELALLIAALIIAIHADFIYTIAIFTLWRWYDIAALSRDILLLRRLLMPLRHCCRSCLTLAGHYCHHMPLLAAIVDSTLLLLVTPYRPLQRGCRDYDSGARRCWYGYAVAGEKADAGDTYMAPALRYWWYDITPPYYYVATLLMILILLRH